MRLSIFGTARMHLCALKSYHQFSGEWGEIQHSRWFAQQFAESADATLRALQCWHINTKLVALGIPSDFARAVDGISTSSGEPLLALIHIFFSRQGRIGWQLRDMLPVSSVKGGVLRSHTAEAMAEAMCRAEATYGILSEDRRSRLAVHIGDGALEGPFGCGLGAEVARRDLMENGDIGAADCLHNVDKAGP